MSTSELELEIFSRQLILKEFNDESFNFLQSKNVSIVGVGGIGCPTAQYLVSSGIKNLNLFDNDIINKSNLNRQILFTLEDVGFKKTSIAKKKLLKTNPNLNINIFNEKINKENISLLKKSSIIIDASDNWTTMKLINKYLISSSAVGFDIQIILFENKKDNHLCLQCVFPNKVEPDLPRCDTVGILGSVAGLAGLISAQKAINFLMNFSNNDNLLTLIDCKTLSINGITVKKNINCKF